MHITDAGLKQLAAAAPPLQVRSQRHSSTALPASCPRLPMRAKCIPASFQDAAATPAPILQTFSLEWCGRGVFLDGIRAVIRACPRLQASGCGEGPARFPSPAVAAVATAACAELLLTPLPAEEPTPSRPCPRAQVFSISCGQQAGGLASVDDALVLELAACCPRVTALELSDTRVGDRGLAAIAAAYGPQLQVRRGGALGWLCVHARW